MGTVIAPKAINPESKFKTRSSRFEANGESWERFLPPVEMTTRVVCSIATTVKIQNF